MLDRRKIGSKTDPQEILLLRDRPSAHVRSVLSQQLPDATHEEDYDGVDEEA